MRKRMILAIACLSALVVITPFTVAGGDEEELEFDTVEIFIEYNDTDQDVGIQVLLDGEPLKRVRAFNPDERRILDIRASRSIRKQGVSELFFESAEPSLDEVSLETFLKRFPEGEYEFEGKTIDGDEIEGEAELTHVIPAGAKIVSPVSDTDDPPVVDPEDLKIKWKPVKKTIDGSKDITIVGYQVIVVQEEPHRELLMTVPATVTKVTIPPEFLLPGKEYGFEVLAKEESGNQTISAAEFETAD